MVISLGTAALAVLAVLIVFVTIMASYMFGLSKDAADSAILASAFTASSMVISYIIMERLYALIMSW